MYRIKVTLLDEEGALKDTLVVESDRAYRVNDHFQTNDGDLWLVSDANASGDESIDADITCIWIGKPDRS